MKNNKLSNVPRLALSRSEVAAAIGVSAGSVDVMVREGALPLPRVWHSRKLWLVSEVEAYLNEWPNEETQFLSSWKEGQVVEPQKANERFSKGSGGFAVVDDEADPINVWYRKLGFDPKTMGSAEMNELQQKAEEKWKAGNSGYSLNERERKSLFQLAEYGAGRAVEFNNIKDCGADTIERLLARGFIETKNSEKFPDRIKYLVMTAAGLHLTKQQSELKG